MKTRSSKAYEENSTEAAEKVQVEMPEGATYTEKDADRAKDLLAEGKRHFVCGNVADAAKCLSEVCEIYGNYYGETAVQCADPYYYYGRILLDLARKEPDVVAHAVEGIPLAEEDNENENKNGVNEGNDTAQDDDNELPVPEENVREQVLKALDENSKELEKAVAKKDGEGSAGSEAGGQETSADGEKAPADDAGDEAPAEPRSGDEENEDGAEENEDGAEENEDGAEENEDGDEENEDGDEENEDGENATNEAVEPMPEEVSNLQLSWEMLDLARVIWEKSRDEVSKQRLADCRLALGEQAIEDEEFEKAIAEFDACLTLQKELFEPDDRRVALTHFNMGVAHSINQKYDEAMDSFKSAASILELRRDNMSTKADSEGLGESEKTDLLDEIKELSTLITDVQNRIQDCAESRTEAATSAQELMKMASGENGATSACPDDLPAKDVSHLVRKTAKRTSDIETNHESKKPKLDEPTSAPDEQGP